MYPLAPKKNRFNHNAARDAIFIIEFKIDAKGDALQQIKDNGYTAKYLNENKDIYLVGIEFNTKEKNISKFEWNVIMHK